MSQPVNSSDPAIQAPYQSAKARHALAPWLLTLLFLALGASAFLIERCARESPENLVVVERATVDRLASLWQSQTQRPPTDIELEALTQEFVREEILVREAKRLGLELDDVIIRRRLAQKIAFLLDDTSPPDRPTEDELRAYFDENSEFFTQPEYTSFQHVFISEQNAEQAPGLLEQLSLEDGGKGTSWRSLGDPFMLRREYAERTDEEVDELFGKGFAEQLSSLPTNTWQPATRSTLGFHIVRVVDRQAAIQADFASVRRRVTDQFVEHRRQAANRKAYEKIAARYQVVLPDLEAPSSTETLP